MMKKLATSIMVMILAGVSILGISGCLSTFDFKNEFIWEGDFAYHEMSAGNYSVLDLTEQGKQKSVLYIPAYFRDGIVTYTREVHFGEVDDVGYSLNVGHKEKVYFPFGHRGYSASNIMHFCYGNMDLEFYANSSEYYLDYILNHARPWGVGQLIKKYYISSGLFNILTQKLSAYQAEYPLITFSMENSYTVVAQEKETKSLIHAANTSYMFNYEGEPNEGYFFINDFERGGLIEDTPYEPRREGYTFAGWYKEPECVNAWDFTKDTLPAAEYDEEGNLLFVETKLYAKWNIAV